MRPRGLPIYAFTNGDELTALLFCRSVYPFLIGRLFDQSGVYTGASAASCGIEGYQRGDQFMVLANILTAEGLSIHCR